MVDIRRRYDDAVDLGVFIGILFVLLVMALR